MTQHKGSFRASRREFITLLGGAAATWPLAARAQQGNRMRRIGALIARAENDPWAKAGLAQFRQGLQELGCAHGHTLRMDVRWAAGDVSRMQAYAKELVGLQPDVILANTPPVTAAFRRGRRGRSRSYLRPSPTRSAMDLLRACPNRAGISPGSSPREPGWRASGWSCSRGSRLASSGSQSCSIPTRLQAAGHISRPWWRKLHDRSRSSRSRRPGIA